MCLRVFLLKLVVEGDMKFLIEAQVEFILSYHSIIEVNNVLKSSSLLKQK